VTRVSPLRSLLALACGAALLSVSSLVAAAACKVQGDADPAPAWVSAPAGDDAAVVSAVGSAPIDGERLPEALAAARTQALRELAERIRVSVSASVKLNDSKVSEGGRQVLRSTFESVAEATTQVTLQNVRTDAQWVDARRCQAWVRMAVNRADFDRARRRDMLLGLGKQVGTLLAVAEDATKPLAQREGSAAAAAALLGGNDFGEVPEVPVAALRVRLGGANKMIERLKGDEKRLLALGQSHVQAYAEFKSSTNPVERAEAAGRALRPLRSLLAAAWVPDETALGFEPKGRLVSLLNEAGYPCQSRKAADDKAAVCPAPELALERQKEYFAGRQVVLACGIRLAGKAAPWPKACGSLAESLAKLGARTEVDAKLDAFGVPGAKPVLPAGVTQIRLTADGRIGTRQDPDDKTKGYRFEGAVGSHVRGVESPVDDAYQAMTGWNPVSDAMATDILAISAAKRLLDRLAQGWQ
jgi:hypothetical protein